MNLKLLVVGDFHGSSSIMERIRERTAGEEITALIVCGDLTHFGGLSEAREVLECLAKLGVPVLFVPGNCDSKELATFKSVQDVVNLHGRYREVRGLGFLGIGGSPHGPFHTPFEISESEMKQILDETFSGSKMGNRFALVAHTPPANTKVDLTTSGIHAGSRAVRDFIEAERPSLVLCGHIHEARGVDTLGDTLIVNPGPAHRGFYAVVDVDGDIKAKFDAA